MDNPNSWRLATGSCEGAIEGRVVPLIDDHRVVVPRIAILAIQGMNLKALEIKERSVQTNVCVVGKPCGSGNAFPIGNVATGRCERRSEEIHRGLANLNIDASMVTPYQVDHRNRGCPRRRCERRPFYLKRASRVYRDAGKWM